MEAVLDLLRQLFENLLVYHADPEVLRVPDVQVNQPALQVYILVDLDPLPQNLCGRLLCLLCLLGLLSRWAGLVLLLWLFLSQLFLFFLLRLLRLRGVFLFFLALLLLLLFRFVARVVDLAVFLLQLDIDDVRKRLFLVTDVEVAEVGLLVRAFIQIRVYGELARYVLLPVLCRRCLVSEVLLIRRRHLFLVAAYLLYLLLRNLDLALLLLAGLIL